MVRFWHLSAEDLTIVGERRGERDTGRCAAFLRPIRERTQLQQDLNAMALNLVVAAITVWNTAYLEQAVRALEEA
jgi:hypothetical protein